MSDYNDHLAERGDAARDERKDLLVQTRYALRVLVQRVEELGAYYIDLDVPPDPAPIAHWDILEEAVRDAKKVLDEAGPQGKGE